MGFDGIEGKVAVVTGAGGGIGEAYARGFAANGAKIVVAELDKEGGERVAEAIRSDGGEAQFVQSLFQLALGGGDLAIQLGGGLGGRLVLAGQGLSHGGGGSHCER